jgi:hypothetical protein
MNYNNNGILIACQQSGIVFAAAVVGNKGIWKITMKTGHGK